MSERYRYPPLVRLRRRRWTQRAFVVLSATFLLGAAVTVGSVLGAFTKVSSNPGNAVATAPDFVAPTASRSIIAHTDGSTPGTIAPGSSYYVYAEVSDTGNPASGVSTVTADVSAITTGQTAASLASGSFSIGGQTYNYRSAALTADSGLSAGSKSYTLTMTDAAANSGTQTGFSVTVTVSVLDHFDIDPISQADSGRSLVVTVRAKDSSGAPVTSYTGTVTFSTNSGTISPTTSYSFVAGVLTQAVTITGAYNANQTITATGSGKTGTSAAFVLHDWHYYFKKTTANTGTNCASATRLRDMEEGYAGSDPEETFNRTTGGATHLRFCSPTFAAGQTLAAGTTTVQAYVNNTAGSSCTITGTIYKNSGGTASSLGTSTVTIPGSSVLALRTWTITTSGTTFAAGDRLNVSFVQQEVKACDSTLIHYGGTTNRSNVQFAGTTGSAYRDSLLGTSGLSSYWRLGETSGTVANDEKGTTDGVYTGGVTLGAASALPSDPDKSASFDGVDDYVEIGDFYDFSGTAPFSVELWFKKDVNNTTDYVRLVDKHKTTAPRDGWLVSIDRTTQKLLFERWGNGVQENFASTTVTTTGTWYYVVGTYDGSAMKLYVNGSLEGSLPSTVSMSNNTVPLRIARSADGASNFAGTVDEVAIYTSALTASQVLAHYNSR